MAAAKARKERCFLVGVHFESMDLIQRGFVFKKMGHMYLGPFYLRLSGSGVCWNMWGGFGGNLEKMPGGLWRFIQNTQVLGKASKVPFLMSTRCPK